ncbi:MAG: hypothetical protein BRD52_06840, partial [Bacteroidetes bacterium SW_4_67_19]
AFVVVHHLSPEHESRLADLLQGHTEMLVEQVEETVALEPGHVYVIPPGKNLSITDDELTPTSFEEPRGQRAPIDFFFRSLAETHGERAVGIVLSGTGQGGTLGLGRIKERGGVTMAQVPDEATHPSMARSAIAANQVDIVAPVAELAEQLARIRRDAGRIALPAKAARGRMVRGRRSVRAHAESVVAEGAVKKKRASAPVHLFEKQGVRWPLFANGRPSFPPAPRHAPTARLVPLRTAAGGAARRRLPGRMRPCRDRPRRAFARVLRDGVPPAPRQAAGLRCGRRHAQGRTRPARLAETLRPARRICSPRTPRLHAARAH